VEVRLFDDAADAFAPENLRDKKEAFAVHDNWLLTRNNACIWGFQVVMAGLDA
jgi:hypothetical protein